VKILGAILALLLLGTMRAEAETFDCQRPSLPLARLICGDAMLRAADAEENEIYDTALIASLDKSSLREEEGAWFAAEILPYNWFAQRHAPIDNAKIVEAYRQRGDTLRRETQLWHQLRRNVLDTSLATSCIALPMYPHTDGCAVAAHEPVAGEASFRYQRQIYQQQSSHSAVIVLAGLPDRDDAWQPVAVAYSEAASFRAPQMIPSPAGRLLVIGGIKASNGEDAAAVYLFNQGSLQMIDRKTWLGTLQSRLPDGLDLSRPIVPDYAKLQAIATVTRSQSSCCPTGAKATIDLAIEDDRVAVEGVNFDGPQSPSSSEAN
jgi:uncharacterized protein